MGHPTIYPTGVTLYDPAKAWNGYTIFPAADLGALLIDMNGREVQLWKGLQGFPNKLLRTVRSLAAPGVATLTMVSRIKRTWSKSIGKAISFGGSAGWKISPTPDKSRGGMRASITTFSAKAIPSDITRQARRQKTMAARR